MRSKDQPIRIACVGLGRLGWQHANNVAHRIRGAELAGICSIVAAERAKASQDWPRTAVYDNYPRMLDSGDIEAVLIASPSNLHCKHIEMALERNLHVFCEKPLAVEIEEAEKISEIVKAHGKQVFMLGFMRRYDPSYVYAKGLVEEGRIGKPFLVRSYGLDPETAVPSALKYVGHSAGIFLDMAIHDIDLTRWFLGSEVKAVYAVGGAYRHPEFAEHGDADNASVLMHFQNGAMAYIYVGRTCAHGYHVETEIVGTHGALRIGNVPEKNLTTVYDDNGVVTECVGGFIERFGEAYVSEIEEFVRCIQEARQPGVTVLDGVESTRAALACTESLKTGDLVDAEKLIRYQKDMGKGNHEN